MHILVTNDDGIRAKGIRVLSEHLAEIANVTVIAPDRNQSGISSAISLETPLRVVEISKNVYQMNGTPADCVKLALSGFLKDPPDMVVSGINSGPNLGDDVIYSGTVGGAFEGRFLSLPPIAVSMGGFSDLHYETAAKVTQKLITQLQQFPFEPGFLLNINVPNVPYKKLKGIQVTRQGDRFFSEPLMPTKDGRGKPIYWLGEAGKIRDGSAGTDFHAISQNYVSISPMDVNLTVHRKIDALQNWLNTHEKTD